MAITPFKKTSQSSASAEILAPGDAIDEGKLIAATYTILLSNKIPLSIVVDSKYLFTSLSRFRVPEDKSIRADVQLIRYNFETRKLHRFIWIEGKQNKANAPTKGDSPLNELLQLAMYDDKFHCAFAKSNNIRELFHFGIYPFL